MMELRSIRDALAKLGQCIVPPPPGFAGGPQLRVTTMAATGPAVAAPLVVAENTFGSLALVTTVTALERVDMIPALSGGSAGGFPAFAMLDPLSQLLSVQGVAVS